MNPERLIEFPEEISSPHGCEIFPRVVTSATPLLDSSENMTSGARILMADEDAFSCVVLATRLQKLGYNAVIARDGDEAMTVMRYKNAPALAIIDWMMPGMDGLEICRRVREAEKMVYIILLTARGSKENIIGGLRAGADDYLVKPFHAEELQARILVGLRVMALQETLVDRVKALQAAAFEIESLKLQIPL
jgi:DNA-binding response OmpR family regulator